MRIYNLYPIVLSCKSIVKYMYLNVNLNLNILSLFAALPTLQFLYVKRRPLSWGQTQFTLFQSLTRILHAITQMVFVPLMSTYCHVSDTMLLSVGIISGAISELFMSIATVTWMVFMGMLISANLSQSNTI